MPLLLQACIDGMHGFSGNLLPFNHFIIQFYDYFDELQEKKPCHIIRSDFIVMMSYFFYYYLTNDFPCIL